MSDLDGDHKPDFAGGHHLGRSKNGYLYRVELELSGNAPPSSFGVFHSNALGLIISAVDIDGDHDTDLIISDRFFGQPIGVWLNDGKGHFVKSRAGRFSPNSGLDLALVAVHLNWIGQSTVDKLQRRLPDYLPAIEYIQPLVVTGLASNQHPVDCIVDFVVDLLHQRAPPVPSAV